MEEFERHQARTGSIVAGTNGGNIKTLGYLGDYPSSQFVSL